MKEGEKRHPIGDIAAVAVAEEDWRQSFISREKPAVQPGAVGGREGNILEGDAHHRRGGVEVGRGEIEKLRFEHGVPRGGKEQEN